MAAPKPRAKDVRQFANDLGVVYWGKGAYAANPGCRASDAALRLLYQHCSKQQRQELHATGYLKVLPGGNRYAGVSWRANYYYFRKGVPAPRMVTIGGIDRGFCISQWPKNGRTWAENEAAPLPDLVLAHKMMIEADEATWRRIANVY